MSKFDLTMDDLLIDASTIEEVVRARMIGKLSPYNRTASIVTKVIDANEIVWDGPNYYTTRKQVEATSKMMFRVFDYAKRLANNTELFLKLLNNPTERAVVSDGLSAVWSFRDFEDTVTVKLPKFDEVMGEIAVRLSDEDQARSSVSHRYTLWQFKDKRYTDAYIGDPSQPTLTRAVYMSKRAELFTDRLDYASTVLSSVTGVIGAPGSQSYVNNMIRQYRPNDGSGNVGLYLALRYRVETFIDFKPSINTIRMNRADMLSIQTEFMASEAKVRSDISSTNFTAWWDNMKQTKQVQADGDSAHVAWASIPLAESGTTTSRTWGIEVETVHAERTRRPDGWEAKYDGSLESDDADCDCGCDDCTDYDSHCGYDDCANSSSCQEFVSPILSSFNSQGLRKLCTDIGAEESNTTPGIHVHVGAGDLTVTDVSRLLFAYGVVERLLKPVYHREHYGYCKETPLNQVRHWLASAKQWTTVNGSVPSAREIAERQPVDRYQDVNTQSLRTHGTIEFRAMGPYYDYDHLVRWAWFAREMVNVSKLGLHQSVWLSCKSLTDVIKVLRAYGQEAPFDKAVLDIRTADLVLASTEE